MGLLLSTTSLALECLGCRVQITGIAHYSGEWFPRGGLEGPVGAGAMSQ